MEKKIFNVKSAVLKSYLRVLVVSAIAAKKLMLISTIHNVT